MGFNPLLCGVWLCVEPCRKLLCIYQCKQGGLFWFFCSDVFQVLAPLVTMIKQLPLILHKDKLIKRMKTRKKFNVQKIYSGFKKTLFII